ncbi:MAG: YgiT-type zinc finger protein [Chloroflexota bacterium]
MTDPIPICNQHHVNKEWRATTFEYRDDGVSVRIPDVYAWVCPQDGEASFTPDTVDQLIATVCEFIVAARHARERRPVLTEYIVSVSPA